MTVRESPGEACGAMLASMRRQAISALCLLFLALGCSDPNSPPAGGETGAAIPAVDALFADWEKPGSPGCALAVARHGDIIYSRGYGFANLDYDIPVTPQTVFDVASVTKQFTAASLSMLALEGRLTLDDDVRRWLPELPRYEAPIRLRHMIYHTSGLRDYLNLFPLAGRDDYFPISHPQILAMMSRQRGLVFPPGERYLYSNTAYMLLAQVIERASGNSFGEFARERIFEPLGMNDSRLYDDREAIIPRRATGYGRDAGGRLREVHNYNFDVAGDGQLYSTVEDLLRWDDYLHGADPPGIYSLMLTEGTLATGEPISYAQGIELDTYRGLRTVGHSGSSWGFRSQLLRFVEPGLAIAIACNADFSAPGELALRVADHFLADRLGPREPDAQPTGDEAEPSQAAVPPPALTAAALREFAGAYYSPELDATYRFDVVAGGLEVRIEQEQPLPVTSQASDQFVFALHPPGWSAPKPVTLDFRRDAAGALTRFDLSAGDERGIIFEKR